NRNRTMKRKELKKVSPKRALRHVANSAPDNGALTSASDQQAVASILSLFEGMTDAERLEAIAAPDSSITNRVIEFIHLAVDILIDKANLTDLRERMSWIDNYVKFGAIDKCAAIVEAILTKNPKLGEFVRAYRCCRPPRTTLVISEWDDETAELRRLTER